MKKACLLVGLILFNSCSHDTEEPTMKELVLANIEKNAFILDEAFDKTAQILVKQGDLQALVASVNTRDAFITLMNGLVKDVVSDVIADHAQFTSQFTASAFQWDSEASHHSAVQNNLRQIQLFSPPAALEEYSNQLTARLALLNSDLALVQNHKATNSHTVPVEQFSLNFGQIELDSRKVAGFVLPSARAAIVKQGLGTLTLSTGSTETLDGEIEKFISNNRDTEVFVGLLLPAVQSVRETSSGSKSSYQKFTDLIFGTQITPERKLFDQQVRYAAFLAGLDFITSADFNGYDEDFASVPVQDAMYHATVVLGWARLNDMPK